MDAPEWRSSRGFAAIMLNRKPADPRENGASALTPAAVKAAAVRLQRMEKLRENHSLRWIVSFGWEAIADPESEVYS